MKEKSRAQLEQIWSSASLEPETLERLALPEGPSCLPSSFDLGTAAQVSVGAAALAGESLYHFRSGAHQTMRVERTRAELECTGYFEIDGQSPNTWEKFSGIYLAKDGYVRIHANFDHHRDGVLNLLELGSAERTSPEDVSEALKDWSALEFETAAAERGLVVAKVRSFKEWDGQPHAIANRNQPLLRVTRIGDAPPLGLGRISPAARPLEGIKALDLTRVLAGPVCGRTLAAYGADVMLINSPSLPNIASIIDTSRGKRSAHLDLKSHDGNRQLNELLSTSHVFVQSYRPASLAGIGFSTQELTELRPGIVCVSLSAYGTQGPWGGRRGFDSLVQSATGFNHAEAEAAQTDQPKSLPVPIFDYASGFLMAFGAQAALLRQAREGGSWHVEVSLLQTANWLRSLGRIDEGLSVPRPELKNYLQSFPCRTGILMGMPHAAEFSTTPARWERASSLPGADQPAW